MADYNSVIRQCVRQMAHEGLKVKYPSGYERRLDTAVRQNVLDGMRQVNRESMRILGESYGADGVEIDAHGLCADDHLPYQGRQYTVKEFDELQESLERPFGQWNCRHNIHYIVLGASPPAYSEAELAEMEYNSTERIEIDGVTKSRYEWSQTMRRLETEARYQNDETEALRAIGDKAGVRMSDKAASEIVDAYDEVCRAAGLEPKYEQMYVGRASSILTTSTLPDRISIQDTVILQSLGAKAADYDIEDADGTIYHHYLEKTRVQNVEVFAGYGTRTPLREEVVEGLTKEFGGEERLWQHVKGFGIIDVDGSGEEAEVHWFYQEATGQVKHKIKRWIK